MNIHRWLFHKSIDTDPQYDLFFSLHGLLLFLLMAKCIPCMTALAVDGENMYLAPGFIVFGSLYSSVMQDRVIKPIWFGSQIYCAHQINALALFMAKCVGLKM